MGGEIFIDTSGFYALLVAGDSGHSTAKKIMAAAAEKRQRFVTTDYIIDETATLLVARNHLTAVPVLLNSLSTSSACRIVRLHTERFEKTKRFFVKNLAQGFSFSTLSSCLLTIIDPQVVLNFKIKEVYQPYFFGIDYAYPMQKNVFCKGD